MRDREQDFKIPKMNWPQGKRPENMPSRSELEATMAKVRKASKSQRGRGSVRSSLLRNY